MPAPTADGPRGVRRGRAHRRRRRRPPRARSARCGRSTPTARSPARRTGSSARPRRCPDGRVLVSWRPDERRALRRLPLRPRDRRPREGLRRRPRWHSVQAKLVAPRPVPDARSSVVRDDDPDGHALLDRRQHPRPRERRCRRAPAKARAGRRGRARDRRAGRRPAAPRRGPARRATARTRCRCRPTRPLQLQLLDADGLARCAASAWLWVRNHAAQGCVGCHEDPERTPPNRLVKALRRRARPAPVADQLPVVEGTTPPAGRCGPSSGGSTRRTAMTRRLALPALAPGGPPRSPRRPRQAPPPAKLPVFTDVTAAVGHHLDAQLRRPRPEQHRRGHRVRRLRLRLRRRRAARHLLPAGPLGEDGQRQPRPRPDRPAVERALPQPGRLPVRGRDREGGRRRPELRLRLLGRRLRQRRRRGPARPHLQGPGALPQRRRRHASPR